MKLFINHINTDTIYQHLKEKLLHELNISLFIDKTPQSQEELSEINILVLQEPNEYFGLHDWAVNNHHLFSFILTWSDKVLNSTPNSTFLSFGNLWINKHQSSKIRDKKFEISHLCGKKLMTYGQSLRHEILARKNEIKIPTNFYDVYGEMNSVLEASEGKEFIFGDSMFGTIIENTSHRGYFTEKIMDCFALKTIPIYWGCSNIEDFFNEKGILKFNNVDDFIYICNNLDKTYYDSILKHIEENYQLAINATSYEWKIVNKIEEILKYNNLV